MKAKYIIEQLLARLPGPESAEQNEAVIAAQEYLKELSGDTPITDAAIKDSFQTGFYQKVKADEMKMLELEVKLLSNQLALAYSQLHWIDQNLSPEECIKLFGEEIEFGKLREHIKKEMEKE